MTGLFVVAKQIVSFSKLQSLLLGVDAGCYGGFDSCCCKQLSMLEFATSITDFQLFFYMYYIWSLLSSRMHAFVHPTSLSSTKHSFYLFEMIYPQ